MEVYSSCEDGGGGDEEEEDGEDAVAQPQVQQQEAAWLPRLLVSKIILLHFASRLTCFVRTSARTM